MPLKSNCKNNYIFVVVMVFFTLLTHAFAAESLSYSGRLVNTNGSPVVGSVNLRFDLASTANTSIILCTEDINNVTLTNGVFHTKLNLDCGTPTLSQILASIASPNSAAIRVTNLSSSKVYSFQELHAVPSAQIAHGLSKLNANNNEVLTWTGSQWEPKPVTGATGGTVTSIVAGSGLSGGTITNSGTIAIASGGVTDTHLAGSITRSKLANGTANYVLVNNGSGVMSEVAQLPLSQGGTGSSTAAGARTNLGLGTLATVNYGSNWDLILTAGLPACFGNEKLTITSLPTATLACAADVTLDATKLPLSGGTMSGAIAMGNNQITGLAAPTLGTDAATKDYVDTKVTAAPGDNLGNHTATTNLALGSNKITVGDGTWSSPGISFTNSLSTGIFNNGGIMGFSAGGGLTMNLSSSNLIFNGSFAPYLRLGGGSFNAANPTYAFAGDPNTGMFNLSTDILGFTTGGVEKMRIQATGEVAIGKTTAVEKLDVAGNIALDGALRLKSDTANYVELRAPAGLAGGLSLTFPATAGSSGQALVTNGAGVLSWATTATTASAVGGDLSGTIANAQLIADSVGTSEIANGSVTYAKLNLSDGDIPLAKLNGSSDATKYLKGDKTWGTFITDVLASTFATVTPSNTVITNADSLLTVVNKTQGQINALKTADTNFLVKNGADTISGAVSVSGSLKIPATPSGVDLTDVANVQYVQNYVGTFGQWLKNGSHLYYDTGAVSVGTNSNTGPNSIESKMKILRPVNKWGLTIEGEGMNQADIMLMAPGGSANNRIGQIVNTIDKMMFRSINDDATVKNTLISMLHTTGYVGVGTHTPQRPLHVAQSTAAGGNVAPLMIERVNNSGTPSADELTMIQFKMPNSAGAGVVGADIGATLTDVTPGSEKGAIIFRTSANGGSTLPEKMRITPGGSVGIGTTSPQRLLQVGDSTHPSSLISIFGIDDSQRGVDIGTDFNNRWLIYKEKSSISRALHFHEDHTSVGGGSGNRMTILPGGNVGIGTSNPRQALEIGKGHFFHTGGDLVYYFNAYHNGTHRYGGYAGATSYAGGIGFTPSTGMLYFSTTSSTGATDAAVTTSVNHMNIDRNGNVGIGTAAPGYKLHVNGSVAGVGAYNALSDKRYKKEFKKIPDALEKLVQLNGLYYKWRQSEHPDMQFEKGQDMGVIAQEVEKVFPEAVTTNKTSGIKSVAYSKLIAPIIESIKNLFSETKEVKREIASIKAENKSKDQEIEKLKRENAEMKARLDRLEQILRAK